MSKTHSPACHLCQEHCDCDRCKVTRAAPMLLEALVDMVTGLEMQGVRLLGIEQAKAAIRAAKGERNG